MAEPIEVAIADLDPDEALKDVLAILTLLGFSTTAWEPGDSALDLTDAVTTWAVKQWNKRVSPALRAQFLDYASGTLLRIKAWTDYNRPERDATFAAGDVIVENRGTFVGTIAAGAIQVKNGRKGFTSTKAVFVPLWAGSGPYPTVTVTVRADEAGSGSNTPSNGLPTYPAPLAAGPAGLHVVTNSALFGADGESEELLKERCRLAAAERGMGPRDAYKSIALDPIGAMKRRGLPVPATWPAFVAVTRARVHEPGNGHVVVYLAGSGGTATGDMLTPDSDVYVCAVALQLLAAVPGSNLLAVAAAEKAINYGTIRIDIRAESLVSKEAAEAFAAAALGKFFAELAIGGEVLVPNGQGYVFVEHVRAVALSTPGSFNVTMTGTSADVALAPGEVAVPHFRVQAVLVNQGA